MSASILPTFHIPEGACIAQAQPPTGLPVTLASPARAVMTDLTHVRAATVRPEVGLAQARETMIYQGVRLLFVVRDMPCVEGFITSKDLEGERPLQIISQRGVKYEELSVADVMTRLSAIDALDLADVGHATVGQVVATLKHLGRHHLIVVEKAGSGHGPRVRGVISVTQVERQLGHSIDLIETAGSFAQIQATLAS